VGGRKREEEGVRGERKKEGERG
jgi:hypothetical protein